MRTNALALVALLCAVPLVACKKETAAPAADTAPVADAQGRVRLSDTQRERLGIRVVQAEAADTLPISGLPAEAAAPLAASTQVAVPYAGVVTRVLVDEGESVRRGQPMLRVQSRDFIALQGDLARARAEAGVAAQQAHRDAILAREGIIPGARRAESQARAAAASASVGEANAMLSQLRRPAGGLPGEYEILAPQSGRVLRRQAAPGQAMDAMAPAFTLADGRELDIRFSAPIALRDALKPGLAVRLPGDAGARVVSVGADTDSASQTLRVRARADDASALVAGQQFDVSLQLPAPTDALRVPASALLPHGDGFVLYLLEGDAYRGLRVEKLGGDDASAIVRGKGLTAGARVVSAGSSVLKTLAPVE